MNTTYQRFTAAVLILIGGWLVFQFPLPRIEVGDAMLQVEVAHTKEAITRGLSERMRLGENKGMLFVFEKPGIHGFWMKDMNFAIDIVWIGQDKRVVQIMEHIAPETFPKVFSPREPIQYVLEVNAGWARKSNIQLGDRIKGL
jgi:uncharacterized protein